MSRRDLCTFEQRSKNYLVGNVCKAYLGVVIVYLLSSPKCSLSEYLINILQAQTVTEVFFELGGLGL